MRQLVNTFVILTLLSAPSIAWAQVSPPPPPPPMGGPPRDTSAQKTGTARLAGRVTALETGRPVRRALVRVMGPDLPAGKSVSTDAEGRWELRDLPAGRLTISVSKGGYVSLAYGQRRPFEAGRPIDVANGQSIDKLDVALPRASAIVGRVVDEFGDPVSGARAAPMRYRVVNGERRLTSAGLTDQTDDLGQFRLYGLAPGEYYVSVQPPISTLAGPSEDRTGYSQTFYPDALSPVQAARVPLAVGEEAQNIVITVAPQRVANLSGTAMTSAGMPIARAVVTLRDASPASFLSVPAYVSNGVWALNGIAPGDYILTLQTSTGPERAGAPGAAGGAATSEIALARITVTGDDMHGISLVASPGGVVRGRLTFDDTPPSAVPPGLRVQALDRTAPVRFPGAPVRPDWSFESRGLAGRGILSVTGLPSGWFLKSITLEGVDVTDTGMEFYDGREVSGVDVRLTRTAGTISGTVQDSRGAAVNDFVVVVFAEAPEKWRLRSRYIRLARPDQSGRFVATGLPASDYVAVALEYIEPGLETDPEFLERMRSIGTSIRVAEGEQTIVSLKMRQ